MRIIEPMRVLVVEEDETSRSLLAEAVRSLGYTCETAKDGLEAWQIHERSRADMIISGWSMPRMNGAELCRAVRMHDGVNYTHFVFTTEGARQGLLEGMQLGADAYLKKPIDLQELELRLTSASRVVSHERTLIRSNTQLRRDSERYFRAARVDPLTRLSNRLQLDEDLRELRCSPKLVGSRYALAICDLDLFKSYNDRYGHLTGDRVLAAIGALLRENMRSGDRCYRFGGEEFVVLLREPTIARAESAMERIRCATQSLHLADGGNAIGAITISIGLAEATGGPYLDVEAWLKRADSALYQAKTEGRNRIVVAERSHGENQKRPPASVAS
jgi:diguanylate cyclase (GGDEF)-like protein